MKIITDSVKEIMDMINSGNKVYILTEITRDTRLEDIYLAQNIVVEYIDQENTDSIHDTQEQKTEETHSEQKPDEHVHVNETEDTNANKPEEPSEFVKRMFDTLGEGNKKIEESAKKSKIQNKNVSSEEVARLWNEGNSVKQISETVGLKEGSVYYHLQKMGIDYKNRT